jgi:tRNA A37 threonylcarbamoyltransferase TsaD
LIVGGVSANQALRDAIQAQAPCPVHIPPIALCTDNAAMIASAGYYRYISAQREASGVNAGGIIAAGNNAEGRDALGMDALPNWPLD